MQRYDKDLNPAIALRSFFRIKFNIIGFQRIKNVIKLKSYWWRRVYAFKLYLS
jgi:hypothetical protein